MRLMVVHLPEYIIEKIEHHVEDSDEYENKSEFVLKAVKDLLNKEARK